MTKTAKKFVIFISIFAILAMPVLSLAALSDPLVPCGMDVHPPGTVVNKTDAQGNPVLDAQGNPVKVDVSGIVKNPCGFKDLMIMINRVVYFVLFGLAMPICAIMFAYAGFLILTAGASTENVGKAKKIFTNAALGLVIAAAAWLIINTIMSLFAINPTDWTWIGFK